MSRTFSAWVLLSALSAFAAPGAKQNFNAFLSTGGAKPLPELAALPAATRALVNAGRVSAIEPRLGVPRFFWAARDPAFHSLRDQGVTPEQAARRYLFAYAPLYRLDPARTAERTLARVHDTGDGAVIVTFSLPEQGRAVLGEELKVVMDQKLQLVALSGFLSPMRKAQGGFRLAEPTAIAQAYQDLAGRPLEPGQIARLAARPGEGEYRRFSLPGQPHPARTRAVYFATEHGLVPGFYVELHLADPETTGARYFSYVLSAEDGRLLYRNNLTRSDAFSYRVWADNGGKLEPFDGPQGNDPSPHPTGTPNQYDPPFVSPNLVTLQNGPISTNDPWLAPGATQTQGNNAFAYADINAPDGYSSGDPTATTTAPGVFDRTYDVTQSPGVSTDQREAAITQLFYDVNFFHDWYYDVGFNEVAGNGQTDNYMRGGIAADPVLAEAEDYSGKNNSNMSTPADGASPVMQMYVFDGGAGAQVLVNGTGGTAYSSGAANFGPQVYNATADAALVIASGTSLSDGCSSALTGVSGKIAVVVRGTCQFTTKVTNAQNGGAVGIVIVNNQGGPANDLYGTGAFSIPVVSLSQTDGADLQTRAGSGTVNLTLVKKAVIDRDGTIDNAIVAHEWGHYIQNRLIGDGNGLNNNQGGGMGEGWSDFHAMLLVVKEADALVAANANWAGVYALAAYTSYGLDPNGYYYGIRRVPYSTDMQKDPLTFRHIADGQPLVAEDSTIPIAFGADGSNNSEVHNSGEVWATMLWECYAALLRDTLGDSPRLTFDQARSRWKDYLVAAYKLTPQNPTFLEARDALLAAAEATDHRDYMLFWQAFAKRGAGVGAVGPDRWTSLDNNPVVESYQADPHFSVVSTTFASTAGTCSDGDAILDAGERGTLTVQLRNDGVSAVPASRAAPSARYTFSFPGGTVDVPASAPGELVTVSVPVAMSSRSPASDSSFVLTFPETSGGRASPSRCRWS